jgi:prepilin-type N-terminal cleavage/methylation domain-containing protein
MPRRESQITINGQAGFSLLELIIAMAITLTVMTAASTLLVSSLRTRTRENARSNALASAQRALNIMSREIGNSGYGLTDNGIVGADSATASIRVRANLNNDTDLADLDEDVRFVLQAANNQIVRFDSFPSPNGNSSVLATNIKGLELSYLDVAGGPATLSTAERIKILLWVELPAGPEQPASEVRLLSEVALRNAPNTLQQF